MILFRSLSVALMAIVLIVEVQRSASQSLDDLLIQKENEAKLLAAELLRLHTDAACNSLSCSGGTDCDVLACAGEVKEKTCAESYGACSDGHDAKRNLDFSHSTVRSISESPGTISEEAKYDICLSRGMDDNFIELNQGAEENTVQSLKWQYAGFPSGAYRIYPGVDQEECGSYDPRLRPWYAAATSGPKDVVIVIDVSGSMASQNRMELTKEAVKTVLTTLTIADHFAVVTFSSNAQQLCGDACGTLLQATEENLVDMKGRVDGLDPSGETNFEAGLGVAFDVLAGTSELTSNCHTAILFMTDGQITRGKTGQSLLDFMDQRNNALIRKATLFTYSLGAGADSEVPRQMACKTNGVWAPVQDGGNLRTQMASFYNYYTLSGTSSGFDVTWVEPYEDATGAGQLTTASVAVYGENSGGERVLVGVIGVDLLTEDINKVEPNFQNLLTQLVARSNKCVKPTVDGCALKAFRETEIEQSSALILSSQESRLCGDEPASCPARDSVCPTTGVASTSNNIPGVNNGLICSIDLEFDAKDAACGGCSSSGGGLSGGAIFGIVLAVIFFVALIAHFVYKKAANRVHRENSYSVSNPPAGSGNTTRPPPVNPYMGANAPPIPVAQPVYGGQYGGQSGEQQNDLPPSYSDVL